MFKFIIFIVATSWALFSFGQTHSEITLKGSEVRDAAKFIEFFEANATADIQKFYDLAFKNRDRKTGLRWAVTEVSGSLGLLKDGQYRPHVASGLGFSCSGLTTIYDVGRDVFLPGNASQIAQILSRLQSAHVGTVTKGFRSGIGMLAPSILSYKMNRMYHAIKTTSGGHVALSEVIAFPEHRSYLLIYQSSPTDKIAGYELISIGKSEGTSLSDDTRSIEAESEMKSLGNIDTYFKCL